MESILKRAQERMIERERSTFIRAQKEIKKQQSVLEDKEQFVTPAYKKRLEEISKLEDKLEKERLESSSSSSKKSLSMHQFCKELLDKDYRRR